MNKLIVSAAIIIVSPFAIAQTTGGDIVDPNSKLIFTYNNVTEDVARQELAHCQTLANHTQEEVTSNQGSAVRGLLKGAAAGAAVGAISGGSGSDTAKVGAAGGLVVGRMHGNANQAAQQSNNLNNYKTVMRNCMVERQYVALN
ncbi:glycine zipper family protein [Vibrio sp. ZSDZ65]|uniref:Glycine zipper family protein n=1 Tax=Vibrio qingdaonensis TaxID=2829491 RepID=A0A9X3CL72_9VIBR|nr:glycine zipper family protein [Vibrio qingdaonensis]MCW8345423.1 glycine zipper family protein [Vibrio qingdaonensis]